MTEQTISLERLEETINVFGSFDENIRIIEHELGVTVVSRDSQLKVAGEDPEGVMYAVSAINNLMTLASRGEAINEQNVRYIIQLVREGKEGQIVQLAGDVICITAKGKPIKAKTLGQKKYVEAIKNNVVTVGVGPAGTGKTYLAVAAAVAYAKKHDLEGSQTVVVLLPDSGRSYLEKIFNDDWMIDNGFADVVASTSRPSILDAALAEVMA